MTDVLKSIQSIIKKYGEDSIFRLDEDRALFVSVIPTGSLSLDIALGVGGLPRGRIAEVFGPELSGKTTLCLHVAANCQALGGLVALVDSEHALDTQWAKRCGVKTFDLFVAQPQSGEQALDIVEKLLPDFDLIMVDSVAALVPQAEVDGEMEDQQMGLQARLMSKAMRKLIGPVKLSGACVVFTNQMRQKIGTFFGSPEVTSGGQALKYYASVRLDIRRKEAIKDKDEVLGNLVHVKVVKNRVAPPFREADFEIRYDEGISKLSELIDLGARVGAIDKAGAGWYSLRGEGEPVKVQGAPALRELLKGDPVACVRIENAIRSNYGLPLRG